MEWIQHPRVLPDAQEHSLSFLSPPPTGRRSPAEAPPGVPGHAPRPPRKGPAPHPQAGGVGSTESGRRWRKVRNPRLYFSARLEEGGGGGLRAGPIALGAAPGPH